MDEPAGSDLIAANLARVRAEIAAAEREAARPPGSVVLLAVSKTYPAETVAEAIGAGQRVFGENRVQEAEDKWPSLQERFPDIRLHLIGPLQRNKVRRAVRLFDVIETVDRPEIARAIAQAAADEGRCPELLVQVNTGAEAQKAGVLPEATAVLLQECRVHWRLPVRGLMCIPPVDADPTPHFQSLRDLARQHELHELSMGMSADFPIAVRCGATLVRVGTAIFGHRP